MFLYRMRSSRLGAKRGSKEDFEKPAEIEFGMRDAERPKRTREHCIDALGRNHVERFVLLKGYTADEPRPDYGYDIVITTFDYKGDAQLGSGSVYVQLKQEEVTVHLSTDNVLDKNAIETFRGYKADVLKQIEGLNLYR